MTCAEFTQWLDGDDCPSSGSIADPRMRTTAETLAELTDLADHVLECGRCAAVYAVRLRREKRSDYALGRMAYVRGFYCGRRARRSRKLMKILMRARTPAV